MKLEAWLALGGLWLLARYLSGGGKVWLHPLAGNPVVTSPYLEPRNTGPHRGVDYRAKVGTPVRAPISGKVTYHVADDAGIYAVLVAGPHRLVFCHLSQPRESREPADVVQGEVIGHTGGDPSDPLAGRSTGPHLHVGYRLSGEYADPHKLWSRGNG